MKIDDLLGEDKTMKVDRLEFALHILKLNQIVDRNHLFFGSRTVNRSRSGVQSGMHLIEFEQNAVVNAI